MFPVKVTSFVYLYLFKFVFSMSIETTDDCGHAPYETDCLVEGYPGSIKMIIRVFVEHSVRLKFII